MVHLEIISARPPRGQCMKRCSRKEKERAEKWKDALFISILFVLTQKRAFFSPSPTSELAVSCFSFFSIDVPPAFPALDICHCHQPSNKLASKIRTTTHTKKQSSSLIWHSNTIQSMYFQSNHSSTLCFTSNRFRQTYESSCKVSAIIAYLGVISGYRTARHRVTANSASPQQTYFGWFRIAMWLQQFYLFGRKIHSFVPYQVDIRPNCAHDKSATTHLKRKWWAAWDVHYKRSAVLSSPTSWKCPKQFFVSQKWRYSLTTTVQEKTSRLPQVFALSHWLI